MSLRRAGVPLWRVCATAADYLLLWGYLAILALLGLLVRTFGLLGEPPSPQAYRWLGQGVLALALTAPVIGWLAWWEAAAPRNATPGKRLLGLRVVAATHGGPLTLRRALLRNALKVALPWELAHTAVWRLRVWPGAAEDPVAITLLACAYAFAFWYVLTLFLGAGRAPYDRLTDTRVIPTRTTGDLAPDPLQ